jgi:hypothetical protein
MSVMPKRKREYEWRILRLRASPAAFVGYVSAPDEKAALKAAIAEFKIKPADQKRLPVLRKGSNGEATARPD